MTDNRRPLGSMPTLTFMQNQMEKGKVRMMKSREARTSSHSQAPNPEDLTPRKTIVSITTIFTEQYLSV